MSRVTMARCDGCGKTVENPNQHAGWLQLNANSIGTINVVRAWGVYDKGSGSYRSDFLSNVSDFCSVDCLARKLDSERGHARPVLPENVGT